jgi:hypothetical protein
MEFLFEQPHLAILAEVRQVVRAVDVDDVVKRLVLAPRRIELHLLRQVGFERRRVLLGIVGQRAPQHQHALPVPVVARLGTDGALHGAEPPCALFRFGQRLHLQARVRIFRQQRIGLADESRREAPAGMLLIDMKANQPVEGLDQIDTALLPSTNCLISWMSPLP